MVKKVLFITIAVVLAGFISLQFFQPAPNNAPVTANDLFHHLEVPPAVKNKLQASCYDCHSNQTQYPWYNKVAPLSWVIADHVKNGKEEMNLSEWGQLSKRDKIGVLSGIAEVLEDGSMPLESYLKLHKEARFSAEETEAVTQWAENAMEAVLSAP